VVENIDTTSRQLKDALESGKTIIVTTLQKFPVIAKEIGELPGKRFAVMCGWPPVRKSFPARASTASCGHVYGLLVRHDMAAGPDGNRGSRPDHCGGVAMPR